MPNTLLTFDVEDRRARAAFSRLKREVDQLESEFNTTRSEAREAGEAIDALGDRSRRAAREVDQLGDESQQSTTQIDRLAAAAKRQNAVWARWQTAGFVMRAVGSSVPDKVLISSRIQQATSAGFSQA